MNPHGLAEAPVQGGISVKPGLRHQSGTIQEKLRRVINAGRSGSSRCHHHHFNRRGVDESGVRESG